jgi:ligand-binding sensor domain-containing protein
MKSNSYLYFFFILLLVTKENKAQHCPVEFNSVKGTNAIKKLGKINDITQDKFGYMWFASQDNHCLIRYDGYNMKSYTYDPADSNSMDNAGGVECVAADSSGCIWTATGAGVDKFDPPLINLLTIIIRQL